LAPIVILAARHDLRQPLFNSAGSWCGCTTCWQSWSQNGEAGQDGVRSSPGESFPVAERSLLDVYAQRYPFSYPVEEIRISLA
jgi:hypothetical protein